MADLLSHLLVAYALFTVVSWRVDWLTKPWAVVGTGGAAIPDLLKVRILLDAEAVERALGVPFAYDPLSTLGGVLLVAGLITLAFERQRWRRVYGLVVAGGLSSLLLDGLRVVADSRAAPYLYPFTNWHPPTPNLYVTSDPRILGVALLTAAVVALVDSYHVNPS